MKKTLTLLVFLMSSSLFAMSADYDCIVQNYRMGLTLADDSSSLVVWDRFEYSTLYTGYVGFVKTEGNKKKYIFYPSAGEAVLEFNLQDTVNHPSHLVGRITANFTGMPIFDSIECALR